MIGKWHTEDGDPYYYACVPTGDDFECETCGWTYNEIQVEWDEEDGWTLTETVGCYRGHTVQGLEEVIASLRETSDSNAYSVGVRKTLRALADEIREANP